VVVLLHPMFANRSGFDARRQAWPPLFKVDIDLLRLAQAFHRAGFTVLSFDFRCHGESQRDQCAGGLAEQRDVVGAVDYVFERVAPTAPQAGLPRVGLVGFGMGASAALAAVGRDKGGIEKFLVFNGDMEGGVGYAEIQPMNIKRLRFIAAIQPAALGALVCAGLRQAVGLLGQVLIPLVDRFCQLRGGYPLNAPYLYQYAGQVNAPVLYVQAEKDAWGGCSEVRRLYDATPNPRQVCWLEQPVGRFETFAYLCEHPEAILTFVAKYTRHV
jgi:uncharacterized protein